MDSPTENNEKKLLILEQTPRILSNDSELSPGVYYPRSPNPSHRYFNNNCKKCYLFIRN